MSLFRHSRLAELGTVRVGGVTLANPFMTASGTAGHDTELLPYMPLHLLGATTVKSLFHVAWEGNPPPRVHTARSAMMNAVGLQGPGVDYWIRYSLPKLEAANVVCVASIWGRTVNEYVEAARLLSSVGQRIAAVEINLSCPNLEGRSGIIAHDVELAGRIVSEVRQCLAVPVWAKLSANTDRIVEVAESVTHAGANAVTLINTMLGLQINPRSARPSLGNGGGGLSGPAIHPIAVRAVYDVRRALPTVDIVGVGGIRNGGDAVEMLMAGASAVQIGTASFAHPGATWKIAQQASRQVYRQGVRSWSEIISASHRL